jgi:HPr kinase/phosphorylase
MEFLSMKKLSVENFFQEAKIRLKLTPLTSESDMTQRYIVGVDINRMGMALTGWFKWFPFERVQILGKTERDYLYTLSSLQREKILKKIMSYSIPCIIFTHKMKPHPGLLRQAKEKKIPVFLTTIPTTKFVSEISTFLEEKFAPESTTHGTLLDVYGVGVLILGDSGIGKSECALDLVERGHRLVADDMVYIKRLSSQLLMGSCSEILKHHMEIRGLGIINIESLFGSGAVRDKKRVELVVQLEEWNNRREYDRLGLTQKYYNILDVSLPFLVIPVRPGRNLAVIIEVAAMNHRLIKLGYFTAQEFSDRVNKLLQNESMQKSKHRTKSHVLKAPV